MGVIAGVLFPSEVFEAVGKVMAVKAGLVESVVNMFADTDATVTLSVNSERVTYLISIDLRAEALTLGC